ncbi:MAG: multidrug transporter EmrE-like cation transporter, partial [Hydrogenophaga sp.]
MACRPFFQRPYAVWMDLDDGRVRAQSLDAHSLPVGTAYAVWTGIGAMGTVILGMLYFNEPATFARLASVGLI